MDKMFCPIFFFFFFFFFFKKKFIKYLSCNVKLIGHILKFNLTMIYLEKAKKRKKKKREIIYSIVVIIFIYTNRVANEPNCL
jgi:hypothetical protein